MLKAQQKTRNYLASSAAKRWCFLAKNAMTCNRAMTVMYSVGSYMDGGPGNQSRTANHHSLFSVPGATKTHSSIFFHYTATSGFITLKVWYIPIFCCSCSCIICTRSYMYRKSIINWSFKSRILYIIYISKFFSNCDSSFKRPNITLCVLFKKKKKNIWYFGDVWVWHFFLAMFHVEKVLTW